MNKTTKQEKALKDIQIFQKYLNAINWSTELKAKVQSHC